MNKKSKIYIAGHTGFVGGALFRKLCKKIDTSLVTATRAGVDLLYREQVFEFFAEAKPDQVYICAAKVGGIRANIEDPYGFLIENLIIQNNLIDACIKSGVKKVLYLGSSCIYPKDYKQPLKEEYLLAGKLEPTNEAYSLAKICGLKLCQYANKQFDTKFISLMPCNVYGPGDHFNLTSSHAMAALIKKICDAKQEGKKEIEIWGSGKVRREYIYIDDLVDCMIWATDNIEKTDTFLNVGTGEDINIIELAKLIAELIGYKGKFVYDTSKPDGMLLKRSDVSKINKLGWKSKISLRKGIKETIKYYEKIKENN